MDRREQFFTATISFTHGIQHFFMRLLPPLIPVWGVDFGYPLWKLGALIGVLSLGTAVGQAPIGVLSDRYDRRYILSTGVGITGISFAAFAAAPALTTGVQTSVAAFAVDDRFAVMAVMVFIAGLGIATLHPVGYPLITANIEAANKGRALGLWGGAAKFGDGIAPAAVGVFLLTVS